MTPDSVPSLAEVSHASSEPDDATRVVMFVTPERRQSAASSCIAWPRLTEEKEAAAKKPSDWPLTSLGRKDLKPQELTLEETPASEIGERQDDDIPIQASCHGGLNLSPKQLADIFKLFDSSQRDWPPKSNLERNSEARSEVGSKDDNGDDAETTVTSNTGPSSSWERKMDSLERECNALKEIIQADSQNMLKLREELETLRAKSNVTAAPTKSVGSVYLAALSLERDTLMERESQHMETIKALKDQLNELTSGGSIPALKKEVEELRLENRQLRLENQIFASQIIENEAEVLALESQNSQLKGELDLMRSQGKERTESETSEKLLKQQIEALAFRLEEFDKERQHTAQLLDEESIRRQKEFEKIKEMIRKGDGFEAGQLETGERGVEVTLEDSIKTTREMEQKGLQGPAARQNATKLAGTWGFCDCFPSAASASE